MNTENKTQVLPFYDGHLHTYHSHDAKALPMETCAAACEKGLLGVSFTDHCDIPYWTDERDDIPSIADSLRDAAEARKAYAGRLKVFFGVELGDPFYHFDAVEKVMALPQQLGLPGYDAVLGSNHRITGQDSYSLNDFSTYTPLQLEAFFDQYLKDQKTLLETCDFDVLTHLTCPIRYITQKFGKPLDLHHFWEAIRTNLRLAVELDRGLEVNTSGYKPEDPFYMPNMEIVAEYLALGGKKIVLGSDAHVSERVGLGFDDVTARLRQLGVTECYYYEQRQAKGYTILTEQM